MDRHKHYHKYYRKKYYEALERIRELEEGISSPRKKMGKKKSDYEFALYQAERRNKEFTLTEEEYLSLVSQVCHYCEKPILNKGMRLDRKDSLVGYIIENVVPCCYPCNMKKGPYLSYEEFKYLSVRSITTFK
jgi:hypothetical protein